jgi:hypothetical protein
MIFGCGARCRFREPINFRQTAAAACPLAEKFVAWLALK